jgi:histidinol-phosphate phosphatase family protein
MGIPYVVLDRDGTLIHHVHHLTKTSEVKLFEDVPPALSLLQDEGFRLGIITNQSVIARGLASVEEVDLINQKIILELNQHGIVIDFVMVCPHMPDDGCACRKPMTALGKRAIVEFDLDPKLSFMVGDQKSDMLFARNMDMFALGLRLPRNNFDDLDYHSLSMHEAAELIVSTKRGEK